MIVAVVMMSHLILLTVVSSYFDCCRSLTANDLMQCLQVNSLNSSPPLCTSGDAHHFHIITSFTRNIRSYAAYAIATNAEYAVHRGYSMDIIDEEIYHDKSSLDKDARWNKIYFLKMALRDWQSRPRTCGHTYLIWFDADLAVVDFSLKLEDVVNQQRPDVEVILSKDKATAPFVGNTGTIVIRVSDWSRRFLDLWWDSYDRSRCCDQNALTWLYDRDLPSDVKVKLNLLPASALNTDFPFWRNHNVSSRVLHLAGVSGLFRKLVFQTTWKEVCRTQIHEHRQQQLGVTAENLHLMLAVMPSLRLNALNDLESELLASRCPDSSDLEAIYANLQDVVKQDDSDSPEKLLNDEVTTAIFGAAFRIRKTLFYCAFQNVLTQNNLDNNLNHTLDEILTKDYHWNQLLSKICLIVISPSMEIDKDVVSSDSFVQLSACTAIIESFRSLVSLGFELVINEQESLSFGSNLSRPDELICAELLLAHEAMISAVLVLFHQAPPTVFSQVQATFMYYKFKCLMLQAQCYRLSISHLTSNTIDDQQVINWYQEAVNTWQLMSTQFDYVGTNYVVADPNSELIDALQWLGTTQCRSGESQGGQHTLLEAIRLQLRRLASLASIKISTTDVVWNAHRLLIELQFSHALCVFEQGDSARARQLLKSTLADAMLIRSEVVTELIQKIRLVLSKLTDIPVVQTKQSESWHIVRLKKKKKK
jgi:hypothetical protein